MQSTLNDPSTIRAILAEAEALLASGPHPERARRDAEALVLLALRSDSRARNRAWLVTHLDEIPGSDAAAALREFAKRRFAGEPIQYIVGETEFYGLDFEVNRDVLIPRPETEHLAEKSIALANGFARPNILDVGTGSGAIAITLAHELPAAEIVATDIASSALAVARRNAARHGVAERIKFVEADLLGPLATREFDLIVSNPPYVPQADSDSLSVEVREFEPALALFAGADGLAIYRRLIPETFCALIPGGFLILEIGYGQRAAIEKLLSWSGFKDIGFTADLQGIPRVASACRP